MSDSSSSQGLPGRRGAPTPLVFNPESVLPVTLSAAAANRGQTVNMPHVRRNITRRLKLAKQECDVALQKITNNITQYIEEQIRNKQFEDAQPQPLREPFELQPAELSSVVASLRRQAEYATIDDAGYEAELEGRHSRQPSVSSSPASLRRPSNLPPAPVRTSADTSPRKPPNVTSASMPPPAWSTQPASHVSRRLSRSIHIPVHSNPNSRSPSRSRSPLPSHTAHSSFTSDSQLSTSTSTSPHPRDPDSLTQSTHSNRRSSRVFFDEPPAPNPFLTSLHELTAIATDISEASISTLTSQSKACHELVAKVRSIGNSWDEHPEWPGRSWHMQVLLALASLTRVVEWWEAENKFWNFSEEGDGTPENKDGEEESLVFMLKPEPDEGETLKTPPATMDQHKEQDAKALMVRDELKTRFSPSKPSSLSRRRSMDEMQSDTAPMLGLQVINDRPSKIISDASRVQAAEALREQADWARYTSIVLELGLDGDQVVSVNPAWRTVVGTDPGELLENGLSRFLHPNSWNIFKDASRDLQADRGNTKEIRFKLFVEPVADEAEGEEDVGATYCEMEAKGMLKGDKAADGAPSHTIWVLKVLTPPRNEDVPALKLETGEMGGEPGPAELLRSFNLQRIPGSEPITPLPLQGPISTALILCRICECNVPEWYFEKHNESCNDVHRFEADIADCNETIAELRSTVRELSSALDRASPDAVPDYRGIPIFSPSTSPGGLASPLQFRPQISSRMRRASVRRLQQRLLDQLEDILQVASEISAPALKEEESAEPIERQLLLTPSSESKMEQVRNWNKPTTEDPALARLVQDTEKVMFGKLDNVLRMRERIRFSEMSRRVWEASVQEHLARLDEEDEAGQDESEDDEEDPQQPQGQELLIPLKGADHGSGDSQSSTPSEYGYGNDAEPTPMASVSPIVVPSSLREPGPQPAYQGFGTSLGTRSSTPSSVSSPLALAVPITAHPPSFALEPESGTRVVRSRRSTHALIVEPRVTLTPPLSPMASPREGVAHLRRYSTVHGMSPMSSSGPLSPRLPSVAPSSRTTPPSLKDFEIIKPISKGAFGSVFLAKKKTTGDYYAIKVLKKADMITKNQITNVKHERMILMKQAESPFVAKLYFTFQSKEYLYLVMEYLNGGDCAALIKSLGSLPEEWTRNYIAEVILGLEYLHKRGVVHRDLKPDNLLIDSHGHLKLTDFGLSRIGLLNRQTRDGLHIERSSSSRGLQRSNSRPSSIDAAYSPSLLAQLGLDSYFNNQRSQSHSTPHPVGNPNVPGPPPDDVSESSGSESLSGLFWKRGGKLGESPLQSFATDLTNDLRSHSGLGTPPADQKFVGTPDYLAPESILGISGDDPTVDWWALGVITYEFLYGIPPFHAESPEKVFSNILSGHIEWHEEFDDYSDEARDFMAKLMVTDPSKRLGAKGAEEVKAHPFLAAVEWDKVTTQEAQFIPQVTDPESTDYFDPRGALPQLFQDDEEQVPRITDSPAPDFLAHSATAPVAIVGRDAAQLPGGDDFGAWSFKNVPVLKQANDDVIRKLKTESKTDVKSPLTSPGMHALDAPVSAVSRRKSVSQRMKKLPSVVTGMDKNAVPIPNPPSPSTSASSMASSPSRASQQAPLTPSSMSSHLRRPSEYGAIERIKANHFEGDARRNSMPSRLRTASISSTDPALSDSSDPWVRNIPHLSGNPELARSPSLGSVERKPVETHSDRAVTCLVAEDNPISQKILETVLTRMGCRCVLAADGAEAISVALGDIKFDCILMDLHMPVVDGEQAARYIKSTNNKNTSTPIIAVSAYSGQDTSATASNIFAASLGKPIPKNDLLVVMRQLGFKTTTQDGSKTTTKLAR